MKFSMALGALAASTAVSAYYIPNLPTEEPLYKIELAPGKTRMVTEAEKLQLLVEHQHFIDITDAEHIDSSRVRVARVAFPQSLSQQEKVKPLLSKVTTDGMKSNLGKMTSFHNRYYKSATGKEAGEWLLTAVQSVIDGAGGGNSTRSVASAKAFKHTKWTQDSTVLTIPGKSDNTIVVGAHMDSVNGGNPTGRAPGADDNGSGSVTILEALRVLLSDPAISSGQAPNTLEFHWYAAEEAGLLGSQAVFNQYKSEGRKVKAMLNQDMTGFTKRMASKKRMGVISDNVDTALTNYIVKVIEGYCSVPYEKTKCGYACSDHASAARAGYPSAFVFESPMDLSSNVIHTSGDTIDTVDFDHMKEHAKLVVGFMYELAYATL